MRESRTDGRPGAGRAAPAGQTAAGHQLTLRAREEAEISGVLHVASFDDHEIVLDTDLGTLTLHGHDLQIKQLDLAQGTFSVEGLIDSLSYATTVARGAQAGRGPGHQAGGGLLARLFR